MRRQGEAGEQAKVSDKDGAKQRSHEDHENRLALLGAEIDSLADMPDRRRRAASAGQRMIPGQEGLAKSLARLKGLLHER